MDRTGMSEWGLGIGFKGGLRKFPTIALERWGGDDSAD